MESHLRKAVDKDRFVSWKLVEDYTAIPQHSSEILRRGYGHIYTTGTMYKIDN